MQFKTLVVSILLVSLFSPLSAWADISSFFNSSSESSNTINSTTQTTQSNNNDAITSDQMKAEAKRWNLSVDDYSHYLELMKNTLSGKWYTHSDPAEVLAINARNDAEREKYAEIVAKTTHDRLESELAMQRAFNSAWQKLYPDLKPIALPDKLQRNNSVSLQSGDQLLLFTSLDNAGNSTVLNRLIAAVQTHANTKLAIFIVGNQVSDKAIRNWAEQNSIPANLVQQGVIVLDHDKGRFFQITKSSGSLPTVILNHRGLFNVISINELNG